MFETGSAAGDDGGAVFEGMHGAEVGAHRDGDVVKEGGAVGLFGGFEFIDKSSEEFGVSTVPVLGDGAAFALGVVAHVVGRHGGTLAGDEGVDGHAVGEDAGGIDLHRGDHDVVHCFHFFVALEGFAGLF